MLCRLQAGHTGRGRLRKQLRGSPGSRRSLLQILPELLQVSEQLLLDAFVFGCLPEFPVQAVRQKADQAQLFVKWCLLQVFLIFRDAAVQDLADAVNVFVLVVKFIISGEVLRRLFVLKILGDKPRCDRFAQLFADPHGPGKVLPAAGGDEAFPVYISLYFIKILRLDLEVSQNSAVHAGVPGVGFPGFIVRLDVDAAHTVQRHDVQVPHRAVVSGRVSGGDDHKALRDPVGTKGLVLQKLKHGWSKGLGYTVDLVQKKDALFDAAPLDLIVDGGDDLAHRIFRHGIFPAAVLLLLDKRKTDGALSGMVCYGVGDQIDAAFPGGLFHDGRLSDSGRTHQKQRPLLFYRDLIASRLVLFKIGSDRVHDLLFCVSDVHFILLSSYHPVYACRLIAFPKEQNFFPSIYIISSPSPERRRHWSLLPRKK